MKLIRSIILIIFVCSGVMGCAANPIALRINEDSKRISSMAEVAKSQLEDCRIKNDKSACDDVNASLNEIINSSNGLSEIFK